MIAGITGHRELESINWIRTKIQEIIIEMKIIYGYTCLASGADQLFAEMLIHNNIKYTAVIPCINYEATFKDSSLEDFRLSKSKASEIIELKYNKPSEKAFNEAGKMVVDNSKIMIAIWNGDEAKGFGGTADIVDYAIQLNKKIIHINPISKTKIFINHG
jgi:hypothetical protein